LWAAQKLSTAKYGRIYITKAVLSRTAFFALFHSPFISTNLFLKPYEPTQIIQYHKARIRRFGISSPMALGWNTSDTQQIRFHILSQIADLSGQSVLDIGSGLGDFRPFLGERFARICYTGIDQMEEFICSAQKLYGGLPNTNFIQGNFWTSELVLSCKKGLAFNLLSVVGHPPGELKAYNPDIIRSHCLGLTQKVEILEGYLDGDFTVFMKKSEPWQ
jgi:SAM-dependent methyltransferase